jgi:hypothetical protein
MNPNGWPSQPDPLLSSAALTRAAVMQRLLTLAIRRATHAADYFRSFVKVSFRASCQRRRKSDQPVE